MARTVKPLNILQIKNAKPMEKDYLLSDGDCLYLRVFPNTTKKWYFIYQQPLTKKRIKLALGTYPFVTLKRARDLRAKYKTLISEGIDPKSFEKNKRQKLESTFEDVYLDWFCRWSPNIKPTTIKKETARIEYHLLPKLGAYPITSVNKKLVREILDPLYAEGKGETIKKLISNLNKILDYAENAELIEINPLLRISKLYPKQKAVNYRALELADLPAFLKALDESTTHIVLKNFIKILIHTGVRVGTASKAKWEHIDFDKKVWTVPASDEKTNIELKVPLTKATISIFKKLKMVSCSDVYIFSTNLQQAKHINPSSVLNVIRRIGFAPKTTTHGFRSLISTTLHQSEQNFSFEAIEAVLSHRVGNSVSNIYNRSDYFEQRVKIMSWWSEYINSFKH